jgi:DNA-directed RNA polymerase subunit E'/Rpb7
MDALFERRELNRKVHIYARSMQKNMQTALLAQLKMNFEGRCSSEGYVQPNSITILNYSLGRTNSVNGGIDYDVTFQADLCLPHQGQILKANVSLKSKIGIHAETPPIKVLIPRDLHLGNSDFETVEAGQDVEFEVIGAQFKQLDKDITVVGRLRSAVKAAPLMPLLSAETSVEMPNKLSTTEGDEKTVTIVPTADAPKKKTRKLKKGNVDIPNESFKEGMVEGTD